MNERIQELIEQATTNSVVTGPEVFTTPPIYFDKVKFAELLIREVCNVVLHYTDVDEGVAVAKKHFGVI